MGFPRIGLWLLLGVASLLASAQSLRINEVMPGNATSIQDENGEEYSWIELYNSGEDSVSLNGYFLSNNPGFPYKWKFGDYYIKAHEFLIIFASERDLQAGPAVPTSLGHLKTWFRASDIDTANTTQVNRVNDQYFIKKWLSYNGLHNASQTTTTKQPLLAFNAINGLKALRFNGTTQMLISNVTPPTGNLPRTFFVIFSNTRIFSANQASNNHILQYGTSSTGQSYGLAFQRNNLGGKIGNHYWSTTFYGIGIMDSAKHCLSSVYRNGSDNFFLDGAFAGTNYINLNTGSSNAMRIASRNGSGSEYFGGDIAEIVVYDTLLTDSQRRRVENYFAQKYGLPFRTFHTNFDLSSSGQTIVLTAPDSTLVSQVVVPAMRDDLSYGYSGDTLAYFSVATPGAANNTAPAGKIMEPPQFSKEPGFYTDSFDLTIVSPDADAAILYTLDGSDPDTSAIAGFQFPVKSAYPACNSGPVGSRTSATYVYSQPLQVNPKYNIANDRSQIQAAFLYWNPTTFNHKKVTVVKAMVWKPNAIKSKIITKTYFVDSAALTRYHLPVVSVVMPDYDLFDYDTGIYVPGRHYDQTCNQTNKEGNFDMDEERSSHFELFTPGGTLLYRQYGGARVHGNYSTNWPRKSLRYEARGRYEDGKFEYGLFPGLTRYPQVGGASIEEFNSFIIRNSGNNWDNNLFLDAMTHRLLKHLNVDGQTSRAVVHFLNGEFWGIMNLREKHDEDYFASHYDMDAEDVIIANGRTQTISAGYQYEYQHYISLENYVNANSMAVQANCDYVNTQMDIDNYLLHFMAEIYVNNTDFLGNNRKYWRKRTPAYVPGAPFGQDGRWRWLLYDLDQGFTNPSYDRLTPTTTGTDLSTRILRKLLDNTDRKNEFINLFCDEMNSSFLPARVVSIIDSMKTEMDPDMPEHIQRWGGLIQQNQNAPSLISFAQARPYYMRQHLKTRFSLGDSCIITLQADKDHGKIKINSLTVDSALPGVADPQQPYPWAGVYFKGVPLNLIAIPNEGFLFSHWEGVNGGNLDTIAVTPAENLTITAHFIPVPTPEYELVHFWLFDNNVPNDLPLDSINATYSLLSGAKLKFHSALNGYPFTPASPNWRKASMERRNAPTPINYRPNANNNLPYGAFTMRAVQIKQPFTGDGGENTMYFVAPTTGYEDIKFSFAAKNELAADGIIVEYSTTGTPLWTSAGLTNSTFPLSSDFQLFEVDFSNVPAADENPDFQVRLRFYGSNMATDLGNRVTFNNVSVDGVSTYVPSDYYSKATGDLNLIDSWGSNPDGSGQMPLSFDGDNTTFHVQNRTVASLESNWGVSGIGSRVIVGDGTSPVTLSLNAFLSATADVANNATLIINVNTMPTLGVLASGSTVSFSGTAVNIPYASYDNLKFSGINPAFTSAGTITIQGNLTLDGVVTMPVSRGSAEYSLLFTGGGNQLVNTSGNVLRAYNMTFTKSAGSIHFTPGSIISADNQFAFIIGSGATFADDGITLYAGSSVNIAGTGSSYNFTGTMILAGTEPGIVNGSGAANNFNIRDENAYNKNAVAALNNLIIRVPNTGGEFRLRDGSTNIFTIKGNLIVESGASGKIRFYNNDVFIGGNFIIQNGFAGTIDPVKSITCNGGSIQTIASVLPLNLTRFNISNTAGQIIVDGTIDVATLLSFSNGKVKTTANGLVKMGLTGQITGYDDSRFIEGSLGLRSNTITSQQLFYPVGITGTYMPFTFTVTHSGASEMLYTGRIVEDENTGSLPEELEYLAGPYRFVLEKSGTNSITNGGITLPFVEPELGFDTTWLRVAQSTPGGWINLGGVISGNFISAVENFTEPTTFALAKAVEPNVVPDTLAIRNSTIPAYTDTCFAALQKITVAGYGTSFTVASNGTVNMIAGTRITILPYTSVVSGGYLRARIDPSGNWCSAPALPSSHLIDTGAEAATPKFSESGLKVYPNPTSGRFILELDFPVGEPGIAVELFNSMGAKVQSLAFAGGKRHFLDITMLPSGVYMIRILGKNPGMSAKIIRQ